MKKILILNGHPHGESYNYALAAAYEKGAKTKGAEVRRLDIAGLRFNVAELKTFADFEIPADLAKAQDDITWADHLVWVHPVWWANIPGLTKSFMEQTFLMGFAAKYEKGGKITKLLKNKTARIICTMDTPTWFFKYFQGDPVLKTHRANLQFCGIKPVKRTYFGPVINSNKEQRAKWLQKVEVLGNRLI